MHWPGINDGPVFCLLLFIAGQLPSRRCRAAGTWQSFRKALKDKVHSVEGWLLAEDERCGGSQARSTKYFDESLFGAQMHDFLSAGDLQGAAAEYARLAGTSVDFETWLYNYMNDDERRSTVMWFNPDLFSWINAKYLLGARSVPVATPADVLDNAEALAEVVLGRVQWPLPRQGVAASASPGNVPVSLVYCGMDPDETRPWVEYPQKCRLCLVYRGLLYSGYVWDFSRHLELNGQGLVLSEVDDDESGQDDDGSS